MCLHICVEICKYCILYQWSFRISLSFLGRVVFICWLSVQNCIAFTVRFAPDKSIFHQMHWRVVYFKIFKRRVSSFMKVVSSCIWFKNISASTLPSLKICWIVFQDIQFHAWGIKLHLIQEHISWHTSFLLPHATFYDQSWLSWPNDFAISCRLRLATWISHQMYCGRILTIITLNEGTGCNSFTGWITKR